MIGQQDGKALFLILFQLLKLVKQFLLSEEVFDFSRGEMTQSKIKELKQSLNSEFQLIHELCLYVLSASQRTELIRATLSTLHAFLSWIPLGYIFESPVVCALLDRWLLYCL
ncbi:protein EXPORTIN 1B-like isoform X2 [Humulus lupulus]|uniref:protein EXPORTIN 1B-like isoform X2 n=1 Tax=Humulus lupulus TaxID=3486 RepID=UPI002B40E9AA|nr:protein EXPORTIN 1B-like isoform X2 [Humulus lupulus]